MNVVEMGNYRSSQKRHRAERSVFRPIINRLSKAVREIIDVHSIRGAFFPFQNIITERHLLGENNMTHH